MEKKKKKTEIQYCTEVQYCTKKHTHIYINIQFTQLDYSLSVISYTLNTICACTKTSKLKV